MKTKTMEGSIKKQVDILHDKKRVVIIEGSAYPNLVTIEDATKAMEAVREEAIAECLTIACNNNEPDSVQLITNLLKTKDK